MPSPSLWWKPYAAPALGPPGRVVCLTQQFRILGLSYVVFLHLARRYVSVPPDVVVAVSL